MLVSVMSIGGSVAAQDAVFPEAAAKFVGTVEGQILKHGSGKLPSVLIKVTKAENKGKNTGAEALKDQVIKVGVMAGDAGAPASTEAAAKIRQLKDGDTVKLEIQAYKRQKRFVLRDSVVSEKRKNKE
jgi:hypothetical protein